MFHSEASIRSPAQTLQLPHHSTVIGPPIVVGALSSHIQFGSIEAAVDVRRQSSMSSPSEPAGSLPSSVGIRAQERAAAEIDVHSAVAAAALIQVALEVAASPCCRRRWWAWVSASRSAWAVGSTPPQEDSVYSPSPVALRSDVTVPGCAMPEAPLTPVSVWPDWGLRILLDAIVQVIVLSSRL